MSTSSRFALVAALTAALCLPSLVVAQTPTPPDVVRLRDGTFLRGTLVERSPTQVVVLLQTGETRTYPADLVEFAGPDDSSLPVAAPPPPPPPPVFVQAERAAPRERVARLHVRSNQPQLSLQRLQGSATVSVWNGRGVSSAQIDSFGIMCNIPCDIEVPEGTYQLGVAQGDAGAVRADGPRDLRGDMALHVDYSDRSGTRVAGWLTFIGSMVVGGGLMLGAMGAGPTDCSAYSCRETLSMPMLIGGAVVMTAGSLVGMILAWIKDTSTIAVEPSGVRF